MGLKHSVYDSDAHFSINPVTRVLQAEASGKTSLIQYDHNSERFTFEIPRTVEGHDMSLCDKIEVHYNNIDAQTKEQSRDFYEVDDMQISPDDDSIIILSWLISRNATKFVGSLNFLIRFSCTNEDGETIYAWNTAIYSKISVSSGIYNADVVAEQYADVLNEWKKELEANQIIKIEQTKTGFDNNGVNVWTATFGDGRTNNFEVKDGKTPVRGVDYWTNTDVANINQQNKQYILDEVGRLVSVDPEFVDDISKCTDVNRLYVLPDGYIYGAVKNITYEYTTNQIHNGLDVFGKPLEDFDDDTGISTRYYQDTWQDSTGNLNAVEGYETTGFIPATVGDAEFYFKKIQLNINNENDNFAIYDKNHNMVACMSINNLAGISMDDLFTTDEDGNLTFLSLNYMTSALDDGDPMYVRFSSGDISDLSIITLNEPIKEVITYEWKNTGHKLSGEDGGYYIPSIQRMSANTYLFDFTPSQEGMAPVPNFTISLSPDESVVTGEQLILIDTVTAKTHVLTVANGVLTMTESEG